MGWIRLVIAALLPGPPKDSGSASGAGGAKGVGSRPIRGIVEALILERR